MSANSYDGVKHVHKWSHKVDVLTPLLEEDGEFTLRGAGVPYDHPNHAEIHGLMQKFQRLGLIQKVDRRHIDNRTSAGDTDMTVVNVYEWNPEARAELQAIREQSDTLPCGHRKHVPSATDDPEGVISCKFCGREYDRERFRELIG